MDRWDFVGAGGVSLVAVAVTALTSWPWGLLFVGAVVLALYVLHETRRR